MLRTRVARAQDGLMTPLTIGRNHVLTWLLCTLRCYFNYCDIALVHCDVPSTLLLLFFRWLDVVLSVFPYSI